MVTRMSIFSITLRLVVRATRLKAKGVNIHTANIPFSQKVKKLTQVIEATEKKSFWVVPFDLNEYMVT